MTLYASIDIGTNSAILQIASMKGNEVYPCLEKICEPRLGEGVYSTGEISEKAWHRLEKHLYDFRRTIARLGARLVEVAGTQVLRKAKNSNDIAYRIEKIFNKAPLILTGKLEAELLYSIHSHIYKEKNIGVIDIGGGSTEVSMENTALSFPIGAVTLKENKSIKDLAGIRQRAEKAVRKISGLEVPNKIILVGGTAITLAMMDMQSAEYQSDKVNGYGGKINMVTSWIKKLDKIPITQPKDIPGLSISREDIIIPGLCIMEAILNIWPKNFIISVWGLRHSLIFKHLIK